MSNHDCFSAALTELFQAVPHHFVLRVRNELYPLGIELLGFGNGSGTKVKHVELCIRLHGNNSQEAKRRFDGWQGRSSYTWKAKRPYHGYVKSVDCTIEGWQDSVEKEIADV